MRTLDGNPGTNRWEHDGSVVFITALPITVASWTKPANDTAAYTCLNLQEVNTGTSDWAGLSLAGNVAADPYDFFVSDNNNNVSCQGGTFVKNVLTHICGVQISATSRITYADGVQKQTSATSRSPVNMVKTKPGHFRSGVATYVSGMNGDLGECAVWNAALDAAEVAALAKGFSPLLIRPSLLVGYWPMQGNQSPEPNLIKINRELTLTGSSAKADHPRMFGRYACS